jgi:cold-inducible RNA-binding protein
MKIYVGNLIPSVTDVQLEAMFTPHGAVSSAKTVRDSGGQGRGFGFVEMTDVDAARAIQAMNGSSVEGRPLTVNEARPQKSDRQPAKSSDA